jgi:type I restriction enzyme S subunit
MRLTVDSRQLPVGWIKTKLGDVCKKVEYGSSAKSKPEGKIPVLRMGNIQNGVIDWNDLVYTTDQEEIDKYLLKHNDILFNRTNSAEHVGKTAIYKSEKPAIFAGYLIRIHRKEDLIDADFLNYYLNSNTVREYGKSVMSRSVNQANINGTKLKEYPIFLPTLLEQKQIVVILDEAFEGIDRAIANTEKNFANSRELFESYLNFKLLAVASSKPTQTLSCITELIIDCEHKTAPTQETGIPSIRTPNIGKGYLIFDNLNRVSEETYELWTRRGKPESGDLILAREAPAGNVGVIPPNTKVCLGQRTVLIRPNKESVDSQYLAFLLLHPFMQKRLLSKSTGATVQHVNMKDIRELAISQLPAIQAQRACIKELEQLQSQVNRLEAIYCQKIAALKELKQSILQKAFTGELTADKAKNASEEIAA